MATSYRTRRFRRHDSTVSNCTRQEDNLSVCQFHLGGVDEYDGPKQQPGCSHFKTWMFSVQMACWWIPFLSIMIGDRPALYFRSDLIERSSICRTAISSCCSFTTRVSTATMSIGLRLFLSDIETSSGTSSAMNPT